MVGGGQCTEPIQCKQQDNIELEICSSKPLIRKTGRNLAKLQRVDMCLSGKLFKVDWKWYSYNAWHNFVKHDDKRLRKSNLDSNWIFNL